ncbi:carbohydrate kinase family protein [Candidatus Peregrinibacteria bacterium]|nr:carbohydrate kinase family protein [Candidatus Peregrinibacteria bacterium]
MKKILVSGSIAFDYIMNFSGIFKDAILKKNLGDLNVSFTGMNKKKFYGGCGPNIVYNIGLFRSLYKVEPYLFGVAGADFKEYGVRLKEHGINVDLIGIDRDGFTACAYILTDKKENQITIFSPGAMQNTKAEKELTDDVLGGFKFAILSPDITERTYRLGKKLVSARVPWFFDPGQMTPAFKINELKFLINNAYGFIANSYEIKLLCERVGVSKEILRKKFKIFIETLGASGVELTVNGTNTKKIPAYKPAKIVDPTGCGDAFRGGFLAALCSGLSVENACKVGAKIAARKIETEGTQNHKL